MGEAPLCHPPQAPTPLRGPLSRDYRAAGCSTPRRLRVVRAHFRPAGPSLSTTLGSFNRNKKTYEKPISSAGSRLPARRLIRGNAPSPSSTYSPPLRRGPCQTGRGCLPVLPDLSTIYCERRAERSPNPYLPVAAHGLSASVTIPLFSAPLMLLWLVGLTARIATRQWALASPPLFLHDISTPFTDRLSLLECGFEFKFGFGSASRDGDCEMCGTSGTGVLTQLPYSFPSVCKHPPLLVAILPGPHENSLFLLLLLAETTTFFLLALFSSLAPGWPTPAGRTQPRRSPRLSRASSYRSPTSTALGELAGPVVYAVSPHIIGGCALLSTASLAHTPLMGALVLSAFDRPAAAAACLALSTYLAPDAIWLLPVLAVPRLPPSNSRAHEAVATLERCSGDSATALPTGLWVRAMRFGASWLLSCSAFLLASRAMAGSWAFLNPYVQWTAVSDVTPNLGLWWYLFSVHRPPTGVPLKTALHVLPHLCLPHLVWALPLAPSLGATLALGIVTVFRPYPTGQDIWLAAATLVSQVPISLFRRTPRLLVAIAVLCLCFASFRPLVRAWLVERALNANFAYAASLGLGGAEALIFIDLSRTAMRTFSDDIEPLLARQS